MLSVVRLYDGNSLAEVSALHRCARHHGDARRSRKTTESEARAIKYVHIGERVGMQRSKSHKLAHQYLRRF